MPSRTSESNGGPESGDKIGLIAGSGQFPLIFARKARQKGLAIIAAGYRDETDTALEQQVDAFQWFYLGQLNRLIKYFRQHGVKQAALVGAVRKTRLFTNVKPDLKALALIAGIRHTHDDALLRAFAKALEKEGITIRPSNFLLPELMAQSGCWTKRKPTRKEKRDIELGWSIAKQIGRLDIGQCVVAGGGSILAVEAMEGTDAAISRGGSLGRGQAVVVKVCKPNQDMRFDIPTVGEATIASMHKAGARVLAVEAGQVMVFDRQAMIDRANRHDISILALDDQNDPPETAC